MNNIKFTLREMLVGVVIVLLMIGFGFFISGTIHNNVTSENEKYFKALKVNDKPILFDYAIRTEVGPMLSYGEFKGNQPVSDPLVKGKYFAMEKIEEHYTMHTRTVTYSCGKSTCTRVETYWTWDEVGSDTFHTKTFDYLGKTFKYNKIYFDNYEYLDTVNISSTVRYVFDVVPIQFKGTLYSIANNKTIKDNELYANQTIKAIVNDKEHSADKIVGWFWASWILLMIIIVTIFGILENRFINDDESRRY